MKKKLAILSGLVHGLALLSFLLGVLVASWYFYSWLRQPDRFYKLHPTIKKDCVFLLDYLEQQKKQNGKYPANLPRLIQNGLSHYKIKHKYYTKEDGASFGLSFGDYLRDGGVLYFKSENGHWRLDN